VRIILLDYIYLVTARLDLEPGRMRHYALANFVSHMLDSSDLVYYHVTDPDPKDNDVESVT
jgi:hypothetical protein